jgi:tetratricopeptide (TPR) repeat protein
MPDEKQEQNSDGLMRVPLSHQNDPIEKKSAQIRLKTNILLGRLSIFLFVFFAIAAFIFQTTDLHDRLTLARQSIVLKPNDPELLRSLRKLAQRYESEHLYGKAIETYEKLLAKEEKAHLYPASGNAEGLHEATVDSLESLYQKRFEYAKLAKLYKSHLAEIERRYGSDDTMLLTDIDKLMAVQKKLGKDAEVESLRNRWRTIIQIARARSQRHHNN